jgi:hypothetical protein
MHRRKVFDTYHCVEKLFNLTSSFVASVLDLRDTASTDNQHLRESTVGAGMTKIYKARKYATCGDTALVVAVVLRLMGGVDGVSCCGSGRCKQQQICELI